MHFSFNCASQYASKLVFAAFLILAFSLTASAQYFKFSGSGSFSYAGSNPGNRVFDITPDGKMGVVMRDEPGSQAAVITTFHPLFGDQFDTKTFGFGPLEVRLAQVGNNVRVVALTSQGGPRRIYLFDVSPTGQLTEIGFTDLTTSNAAAGTNMVLSGEAGLGWVGVIGSGLSQDLVCFDLATGAIVKRSFLAGFPVSLVLNEGPGRRVIAYRGESNLKIVNVLDAANPTETASVSLVRNAETSANNIDEIVFSNDGRYAFVANQFHNFAAVDLNTKQIVGTLDSSFRFFRIASFEDSQRRLIALYSAPTGTQNSSALLLVDATNPNQLQILKNTSPAPVERFKFSKDGSRLFAASLTRFVVFNLPDFTTNWELPTTNSPNQTRELRIYGPDDEIIAGWGYHDGRGNGALIGAFPATAPPSVTLSDSVTVDESAGGNANFTVTLSAPTTHRVTIEYHALSGTAIPNSDFTATEGALVLQPGTTSGSVSIPILDDVLDEANEFFRFKVTPNLGNIADAENTVTINDNDAPPSISITAGPAAVEGDDAINGGVTSFLIKLSAPSGQDIVVSYATSPNTASTDDYFSTSGSFTLFAGDTEHEIVVAVLPDRLSEGDEFFFVNLTGVTNATIEHGRATGQILDEDPVVLAFEQNSQRGIALDAVTFVREPFSFTNPNYFGTDQNQRTRIALFSTNFIVIPGLAVTAQAVDAQQVVHQLPVEFVGQVKSFVPVIPQAPVLTQIIVRLPETIGMPGDLQVRIITRGKSSNAVLIGVKP